MTTAVWAENTTQDRLEADAEEHGWMVVESTSEKTRLYCQHRVLTITFGTRERDGTVFTAITGWTMTAGHWSECKGLQVRNLIGRYGLTKERS